MMKLLSTTALAAASLALLAASAQAADPKKLPGNKRLMDFSNTRLIANDVAVKLMDETIPAKVWQITKGSQYVWVSQVEGGLSGTTCVITARVMVLPLTATLNAPLFRPRQTATTFDAQPNSGTEACQELAKTKLKEATLAVVSSVVKS
jgi:opacity protein-like surface antigen